MRAFIFLLFLLFLPTVNAIDVSTPDIIDTRAINLEPDPVAFDNNTGFVNMSNFWNTNVGILSGVNATQFDESDGLLNIMESWVSSLWCRLTGCTMTGDLVMDGSNINFTDGSINNVNYVSFNTTWNDGAAEGRLQWNTEDGTLEVGMPGGDVNLQIGQENLIRATNDEGVEIKNGQAVYISGGVGNNALIKLASSHLTNVTGTSGLATEDIPNGQKGYVNGFGLVRDVDTGFCLPGEPIFIDPNVPGNLTNVRPSPPDFTVGVGVCIRSHATEGIVFVTTSIVPRLNGLSNTNGTGLVNNSIYRWDPSTQLFQHTTTPFFDNTTILDKIFFEDANHWLKRGGEPLFNGIGTETFWFHHDEEHAGGTITFLVTANNSGQNRVSIMSQVGRNNSAGALGNSWMIIPNNLTDNLTIYSDCFLVADELNKTLRIGCDTSDSGADLLVQDDIQSFGTVFADGGIRAETLADFVMNGNDLQVENGSIHNLIPTTFEAGVEAGDEVTTFNEFFSGGLGSFENIQVDLGNWHDTASIFCDDGDCANALGVSGVGNIIMQANISTTNINSTSLNFVYSLVNMLGGDSFTVTANNNVGSGEVVLLTDSTNDVVLSSESIAMPSSMWNQPNVGLRFECDVTNTNRECYVDTISVNGTAIDTTLTNQSGFNSVIKFSDGTLAPDGFPERGIIYRASNDTIEIRGNVIQTIISQQTLNITDSITLDSETITNWDNISSFDDNVVLRNGSRSVTGNLDFEQNLTLSSATGQILTQKGAISTPPYSFVASSNSGMGWDSFGSALFWTTLGVSRMTLSNQFLALNVPLALMDGSRNSPAFVFANGIYNGNWFNQSEQKTVWGVSNDSVTGSIPAFDYNRTEFNFYFPSIFNGDVRVNNSLTVSGNEVCQSNGTNCPEDEVGGTNASVVSITTTATTLLNSVLKNPFNGTSYTGYTFDNNTNDNGILYNPTAGTFTINQSGIYYIEMDTIVVGGTDEFLWEILVNDVAVYSHDMLVHGTVDPVERSIAITTFLNESDVVKFEVSDPPGDGADSFQILDGTTANIFSVVAAVGNLTLIDNSVTTIINVSANGTTVEVDYNNSNTAYTSTKDSTYTLTLADSSGVQALEMTCYGWVDGTSEGGWRPEIHSGLHSVDDLTYVYTHSPSSETNIRQSWSLRGRTTSLGDGVTMHLDVNEVLGAITIHVTSCKLEAIY